MSGMKTPGVYIVEQNDFPRSVVEVATAVPAFVGYTERANHDNQSLLNKPWRITSLAEFHRFFGGAPCPLFSITALSEDSREKSAFGLHDKKYRLEQTGKRYILYASMLLFYANGGDVCYVVSVGDYQTSISQDRMIGGIEKLEQEHEPTMLVIPETVLLPDAEDSAHVQMAMLNHCGGKMRNRFAILDIYEGDKNREGASGDVISGFRSKIGFQFLDFAAAYYPWLNTSVFQNDSLSYRHISNRALLQSILREELIPEGREMEDNRRKAVSEGIDAIARDDLSDLEKSALNNMLSVSSPVFESIIRSMKEKLNLLPPGTAMAGIYTMIDHTRGVWKAPANVSLNMVISPSVNLCSGDMEDLNTPSDGKSVNAIRFFTGEGVLVWGARTLNGHSPDWRYINVRRTVIMLEESIKMACKGFVFEPNVASTWLKVKNMISDFLTGIWKRGGLAGTSPGEAYEVHVGLGETMTPEDILDGILRVTVLVAVGRPAEFIEITFEEKMQES
jgi:phage tail sheath protein FI